MAVEESSEPTLPGHAAEPAPGDDAEEDYSQPILAGEGESD